MGDFRIYDRLIEEIPEDIIIKKVSVGLTWTAVINSQDKMGIAMTTPVDSRPRTKMYYPGMKLKEAAELAKSWNFLEASIGMASINSYYNTIERMQSRNYEQKDTRFCTFDLDLKNKDICMVGHLRHNGEIFEGAKSLKILEMNNQQDDYPSSAAEYFIPECDVLIVTGSAFVNKTMPRLLELGKNAYTIVTGPSVPMTDKLMSEFSIQRVCGFIPDDTDVFWNFISAGCAKPPYEYGRRFCIE